MNKYLYKTSRMIDTSNKSKREMRHKQKDILEEHNKIKDGINQANKAKVFIVDRVQKLEDELV